MRAVHEGSDCISEAIGQLRALRRLKPGRYRLAVNVSNVTLRLPLRLR